jgi:hypothetical protein
VISKRRNKIMALAVTVTFVDRSNNALRVYGTIAASGNYTTGGDTLSFAGQDAIKSSSLPKFVSIQSQNSSGHSLWEYGYTPGTTQANGKMQVLGQQPTSATTGVIPFSELAAAAYPASITGDVITFEAVFAFGV